MTWVLIWLIVTAAGPHEQRAEYPTLKACEAAAMALVANVRKIPGQHMIACMPEEPAPPPRAAPLGVGDLV